MTMRLSPSTLVSTGESAMTFDAASAEMGVYRTGKITASIDQIKVG